MSVANNMSGSHLVSGVKVEIPDVDIFIAGTACVDFSNLNSRKTQEFRNLGAANKRWKELYEQRRAQEDAEPLSKCDLRPEDWREVIESLMQNKDSSRTSTTTFAAAINFVCERQPKIVIFENVETAPWQSTMDYLFPLCGYTARIMKLDTKHFYIPQTRSRKYVVAFNHDFFGVSVCTALCDKLEEIVGKLKRPYSNSVTDFLLPINSHELHRARNEMELAAVSAREKDTDWSFSRSRHTAFREENKIGDGRDWIRWKDNGSSNPPAKMWVPWEVRQTNRVSDLLECVFLVAIKGKNPKHGAYDPRFKAQIIDCSQNVDRANMTTAFGATGCITPCAIPVLTLEARPITGSEALKLQGLPIENFDMSIETQAQLQDLAGNAMSTTVVGATILASLACVADYSSENKLDWLAKLFQKRDYKEKGVKDRNSFSTDIHELDMGQRCNIDGLVLSSHSLPETKVAEILELGDKASRRCVCYHILSYSSLDLYECKVCGARFCKSCRGNPDHQLEKLMRSFEDIGCLTFANAEDKLREFFPPVLPMIFPGDESVASQLQNVLLPSKYTDVQTRVLAQATLAGLSNTTYQLSFIEITDVTRIEYVSKGSFILRAIIEEECIIWYLHFSSWSAVGKQLAGHKTEQPIARAIVGPNASSQFPTSWEPWFPERVEFDICFRLGNDARLQLVSISDMNSGSVDVQRNIKALEGTEWTKHEECGFPESALWVHGDGKEKLYLFKDVNPIGAANKDEFVITATNREMGRTPEAESRPVLLRFQSADQLHRIIKEVQDAGRPIEDCEVKMKAYVTGWWLRSEDQTIKIPQFSNKMVQQSISSFPASPPVSIRQPANDQTLALHGPPSSSYAGRHPCSRDQILLDMSLPIFGTSEKAIADIVQTLKDLDLRQQIDFAEFARLIEPCYTAVERKILKYLNGDRILQLGQVVLKDECQNCAPKLPELLWKKPTGTGSRFLGPIVVECQKAGQEDYSENLVNKPVAFRVDHNVDPVLGLTPSQKIPGIFYVDIRFVGRGHTLLQQARSHLPRHPDFHQDPTAMEGTFAMEFCVLEDPRPKLKAIDIQPPKCVIQDPLQPTGFRSGVKLFKEQLASLEWMLARENDEAEVIFMENEVAEVYVDHLRLRIFARAARNIVRRGRVVADSVGFGKTAVCLGLIDRQYQLDRGEFLGLREKKMHRKLVNVAHLCATLVIVPNQLTQQWKKEAERFLQGNYKICVIETFAQLQKVGIRGLEDADIIICSNKVFRDPKYLGQLYKFCDSQGLNIGAVPKAYRAWYKRMMDTLDSGLRGKILDFLRETAATSRSDHLASAREFLTQAQRGLTASPDRGDLSQEEQELRKSEFGFAPSGDYASWVPSVILELFSFSRIIWDEFPYENVQVTEFVANCPTVSKWMLSGTPPLESLGDIAKVAYLFNVHLARPLALVNGRQPRVCENPPLRPLSQLEETDLYQSRHSPSLLKERHLQALEFVRKFMRKNVRDMDKIKSVEKPLVLSQSTNARVAYLELQQELNNRTFNANNVSAGPRHRLMSRVDWKGKKLGSERAMEALTLRASSSFEDVRHHIGSDDGQGTTSVVAVAKVLYNTCVQTIRDNEDRGRELLGKAFYLAYRLTRINLKNHATQADNSELRQFNYYDALANVVNGILNMDIARYRGWDAYESALRILIWNDNLHAQLGPIDRLHVRLPPPLPLPLPLPSLSDRGAWTKMIQELWKNMRFCVVPEDLLSAETQDRPDVLKKKEEWLKTFTHYLTKTPLHSRRWYLIHELDDHDLSPLKALLEMEWRFKLSWEIPFRDSQGDDTSDLVPVRKLSQPSNDLDMGAFDIGDLKLKDAARKTDMTTIGKETRGVVDASITARIGKSPLRGDWQEECTRRGLVSKSTERLDKLKERVYLDEEKKASEEQYITPESCPPTVVSLPLEGKERIRGSNMEVIFDQLMHTVDGLTKLLDRLMEAHSKRNAQEVILRVLEGNWKCDNHVGPDALQTHSVSLLCGHVHCSLPNGSDSILCGVRDCTQFIQRDSSLPLSKLTEKPRIIKALDFDAGALTKDPGAYLDEENDSEGPKARAVVNLIDSTAMNDQVVVFVQNRQIMKDIYTALELNKRISYVTPEELARNESLALEMFKAGLGVPRAKQRKVLVQIINSEQAAGSNLHNANHVIFVSPLITRNQAEWDAQMKQALGRCIRFRQTKQVYVYHLVIDGTVEVDTLEWRMKNEILVPAGLAVGRFNKCEIPEFLDRFDQGELHETEREGRVISMLQRDDVQFLMGDDYITCAAARSAKTVDTPLAEAAAETASAEINAAAAAAAARLGATDHDGIGAPRAEFGPIEGSGQDERHVVGKLEGNKRSAAEENGRDKKRVRSSD